MALGKPVTTVSVEDMSGGCNYSADVTSLTEKQSPNAMNVEFYQGAWRKRRGCAQLVASVGSGAVGYSIADFGVSSRIRKQVIHFGDTVYALSDLSGAYATIRTGAPRARSYVGKVKSIIVQTYQNYSAPYYWNGSAASMSVLSATAPQFKKFIEFQGYGLCMNTEEHKLRVYYEDANSLVGGTFLDYFTLAPAPSDDEITDTFLLNGRCYVATKTSIFRVSYVAGTLVFEYKQVISETGIVDGTAQVVTSKEFGQVAVFLGYDRRIYLFDGSNIKDISDNYYEHRPESEIALDLIAESYLDNCTSAYDTNMKVYRLFVTRRGDEINKYGINVDVNTFAMYPFKNMQYSAIAMCATVKGVRRLIGATYGGRLDELFVDVNTDNGEEIDDYWDSAPIMPKASLIKQGQTLNLYFTPSTSGRVEVSDRVDFHDEWRVRNSLPLLSSRDRVLGSQFILGQTPLGVSNTVIAAELSVPVSFNAYQFRLRAAPNTRRRWELLRFELVQAATAVGKAGAQR